MLCNAFNFTTNVACDTWWAEFADFPESNQTITSFDSDAVNKSIEEYLKNYYTSKQIDNMNFTSNSSIITSGNVSVEWYLSDDRESEDRLLTEEEIIDIFDNK